MTTGHTMNLRPGDRPTLAQIATHFGFTVEEVRRAVTRTPVKPVNSRVPEGDVITIYAAVRKAHREAGRA